MERFYIIYSSLYIFNGIKEILEIYLYITQIISVFLLPYYSIASL